MVHRTMVVGGDVGVEERHLHGAQAGRGARAQAARVEAQQQVQLVFDGLHLGTGCGWGRGLGLGRSLGRGAVRRRGLAGEGRFWETRLLPWEGRQKRRSWPEGGTKVGSWGFIPGGKSSCD